MFNTYLIGNVTMDPTTKTVKAGGNDVAVTTFNVAVNEGYGDKKTTKYVRVTCWRKTAEACAQYVKKGSKVAVEGSISASAYTNKNGEPTASLELTASSVEFIGAPKGGEAAASDAPKGNYNKSAESAADSFDETESDDLPF